MSSIRMLDILGPIMIGPSSSHTAGACRLAYLAKTIYAKPFEKVVCELHGSFAETYAGHGTDRALAGGLLGFLPDDERIKDALSLAQEQDLTILFAPTDLGPVHPNTVRFHFFETANSEHTFTVMGSSIGGAAIKITNIDGTDVDFSGEKPTLIIRYMDRFGVIHEVTRIFREHQINIATMSVSREHHIATMVMELDSPFPHKLEETLHAIPDVFFIKGLN